MTLAPADFEEFFRAANGNHRPFSWQKDLLATLLAAGRWPGRIAAPTGSGKTSAIDVHVFATALSVQRGWPRLPRRLAMVVDRRVLVDDQYERARALARLLQDALGSAEHTVLREIAEALSALHRPRPGGSLPQDGPPPLLTARLRGGSVPSRSWRDYPASCAVLCATPDMWGSRLLFQGYGTADQAAAREAGLLAFDSALLLDEAHLSRQLLVTAEQVSRLAVVAEQPVSVVPALQVVAVSATPAPDAEERAVEAVDGRHFDRDAELATRLLAAKPATLIPVPGWPLARQAHKTAEAAAHAVTAMRAELQAGGHGGSTVGCFVNSVAMALDVASRLRAERLRVVTVCGQVRPADLDRLRARYPGLLSLAGSDQVDVLVTTQSLEVGVDLDLAGIVTELASGPALAQRAGRVNRLGKRAYAAGATAVAVLVPPEQLPEDKHDVRSGPYCAAELNAALRWLTALAGGPLGMAPWAVHQSLLPGAVLRRPLLQRPELADAWHWARTSDDLTAEPQLDLWLADSLEQDSAIGIAVRDAMPADPADALDFVRCLPPERREVFPVPYRTARAVLDNLSPGPLSLGTAGSVPCPVRVRGEEVSVLRYREGGLADVRPGDVVVLDSGQPIATPPGPAGTFSPPVVVAPARAPGSADGAETVPEPDRRAAADVLHYLPGSLAGVSKADGLRGHLVLRIEWDEERTQIAGFPREAARRIVTEIAADYADATEQARRAALAGLLAALPDDGAAGIAPNLIRDVIGLLGERVKNCDVIVQPADAPVRILVLDRRRAVAEEDRQVFTRRDQEVPLQSHQDAVGDRAGWLASEDALALPTDLGNALRVAGLHHDDGKADRRFQEHVLGKPGGGEPFAKSSPRETLDEMHKRRARAAGGLPGRWRHEQRSVVDSWDAVHDHGAEPKLDDPELSLRLIGTSHGHGRSGFPHTAAGLAGPDDGAQWRARAADLFDLGGWDELIERTQLRYGVWGCAYLEAVLRAADCQVSAEGK
jgi:CRISPR-associated endonuclease/helicase Cas3